MNVYLDASPEEQIAYVGRMLFERRLTDIAGGNISLRVGDDIYISPRYSGAKQHWNIAPETIVHGPIFTDDVIAQPGFSREGKAHLLVYRAFPQARAIVHSHPFHVLPFCAAGKEIPPVIEATEKFGPIRPLPFAPAHSLELAEIIREALKEKEELITRFAAPLLLSKHGIFVVSNDLFRCLDTVERVDWNAWCLLANHFLE